MISASRSFMLAAVMALACGGVALADRDPTPEERNRIETQLRELGFTAWDDIELEDDESAWEVDDALAPDGKEYDLKLDPDSLSVIRQALDD